MNEREIFDAAVEITNPSERAAYLERMCGGDSAQRDRLTELLDAQMRLGSFLESPPGGLAATIENTVAEKPGTEIGRYKLREKIGEGGFGVVYVAEQSKPVQRKVALKIVKLGMDTKEVVARFEAERQALALMDHPNVARVIDAGTTESGRPFFVMELVHGLPITDFCDKNKLPTRNRLQLFLKVCQAVQHAHQKGIIHRDLKPSNIMVTLHDGSPVPKVIDFGVAKALSQKLTEKTIYTSYGQVVGTPQYMSPEQAEMSGLGIDTRSDIYSLGVLLYELLTGKPPVDRKRLLASGYAEMMRIIREEEPPRPSRRVSTLGQEATAIAQSRCTDEKKLSRSLRGELDWIVMKSLEKDRERRYETAADFAADIGRFLANEAVHACPPSTSYRLRKLLRRNPASVAIAAATVVALMLAVGLLVSFRFQRRLEVANKVLASMNGELSATNSELDTAKNRLQTSLMRETESRQQLRRVLYFRGVSEALSSWNSHEIRRAQELLDACPENWRHWEWHYVNHVMHAGVQTLGGHRGWVSQVAVSADGGTVAATSHGRGIVVWSTESGTLVEQHDENSLLASNGNRIVNTQPLRSNSILRKRFECEALPGVKGAAAISPNGQYVAHGNSAFVSIVRADSHEEIRQLHHGNLIRTITFNHDGRHLTSAGGGVVKVWDTESWQEIWMAKVSSMDGGVTKAVFSPDGTHLATVGGDEFEPIVKLWNAENGSLVRELEDHLSGAMCVAFSPNGHSLVTGSYDQSVKVWDVESGQVTLTLKGHTDVVQTVRFTADGRTVVSGGRDQTVRVWDLDAIQQANVPKLHSDLIRSVAFSPDGKRIASGSNDETIRIWDARSGERVALLGEHTGKVHSVAFDSLGGRLVSGSADHTAIVWDASSFNILCKLQGHATAVFGVAFSPDGARIATTSYDGQIKLWDAQTGKEIWTTGFETPNWAWSVEFSPDGDSIATGHYVHSRHRGHADLTLKVWDSNSGREVMRFPGGHTHRADGIVFDGPGRRILTGSLDSTVRLWNVETGREERRWDAGGWVHSVALSPDGERAAAATQHGTIRVWDTQSGQEALTLQAHKGAVRSIDFSQDGSRIVSGGDDGAVRVWDAGTADFIGATK